MLLGGCGVCPWRVGGAGRGVALLLTDRLALSVQKLRATRGGIPLSHLSQVRRSDHVVRPTQATAPHQRDGPAPTPTAQASLLPSIRSSGELQYYYSITTSSTSTRTSSRVEYMYSRAKSTMLDRCASRRYYVVGKREHRQMSR